MLWVVERIIWVSIISYREICFNTLMLWSTSMIMEKIMLADQGFIIFISCVTSACYVVHLTLTHPHMWSW